MRVSDVIKGKGLSIQTVDQKREVRSAIQIMHESNIGSVVIVNEISGKAIGIVSQMELLAAIHDLGAAALSQCIAGIMRRPAPQCLESDSINTAMSHMTQQRARHLIVVNSAGDMVGLVSMGDLVAGRINSCELEADVLRDMARSRVWAAA